jgi:hypothetical protein
MILKYCTININIDLYIFNQNYFPSGENNRHFETVEVGQLSAFGLAFQNAFAFAKVKTQSKGPKAIDVFAKRNFLNPKAPCF